MKTSVNKIPVFEHLLSIPQEMLQRQLAPPGEILRRARHALNSSLLTRGDPQVLDALLLHQVLLLVYAMQEMKRFKVEDYLFLAADVVFELSGEAMVSSLDKGPVRNLHRRLDRISLHEGRPSPLESSAGSSTSDYQALAETLSRALCKIHRTVLTEVLTRYRLTSVLEVFQKDPRLFIDLAEKSRTNASTVVWGEKDSQRLDLRGMIEVSYSKLLKLLERLKPSSSAMRPIQVQEALTFSI